jgi:tRNA-2-methylthio-N6-dimethylallyladenosine synthase
MIGRQLRVLVEGPSKRGGQLCGRSSDNKMCVFPDGGQKPGEYVDVLVEDCTSATLITKII